MIIDLPGFIINPQENSENLPLKKIKNLTFIDRTLKNASSVLKSIYIQAYDSSGNNRLFDLNPQVKVIALIYMVIINSIVHSLISLSTIFLFFLILFLFAGINILQIYKKIIIPAFFFGFIVVLPASLNIISPGKIILNIISFDKSYKIWIYHIPQNIGFTFEGFRIVTILFLKVLNSVSVTLFICYTTSFQQLIKSFKILGIPDSLLMTINLAYKFIFILSRTIEDTYFAIKSRLIGFISGKNIRKLITERIFFIYKKSHFSYEQTYMAMISRGYEGKILLVSPKKIDFTDILSLLFIIAFGILILFL